MAVETILKGSHGVVSEKVKNKYKKITNAKERNTVNMQIMSFSTCMSYICIKRETVQVKTLFPLIYHPFS